LPSPTISHLICTSALVMLIFVMPFFYAIALDNIRVDMMRRELKEITDYVSNTLANLYFLVNSTNCLNVTVMKELVYLPSEVENSIYIVKIDRNGGNAMKITAYLKDRSSVAADAWLVPGLKVGADNSIESGGRTVIASCSRNGTGVYVQIMYGDVA